MSKLNNIVETYKDNVNHYLTITNDLYTATQWAAIATETDLNISRKTLIESLH